MTTEEVQQFLDEPRHLVRIGTVDPSGAPHVVPTWFIVRDGTFLVTPRERSSWLPHLRGRPRGGGRRGGGAARGPDRVHRPGRDLPRHPTRAVVVARPPAGRPAGVLRG